MDYLYFKFIFVFFFCFFFFSSRRRHTRLQGDWSSDVSLRSEEEKERPRIGTTATVQSNGRDSINYSTITERRFVVSKEQIMALPNLSGYWKYSDSVVRF